MHRDEPDLRHVCFEGKRAPLVRRAAPGGGWTSVHASPRRVEPDLPEGFARWVLTGAGLDPAVYRRQPLERRVPACLRALKTHSVNEARRLLERRPALFPVALGALLIAVTEFARDRSVFDDLRTRVVGALSVREGPLRAWSAACASGAELYTLAILLAEANLLDRSVLFGTDCRPDVIAEAERAVYPPAAVEALPGSLRHRYLEPAGTGWRVIERLRRRATWSVSDLTADVEPGPWDVILCRNLAIYLNAAQAARMFTRLADSLRPGGFLVVGKAEGPPPGSGLQSICRCIYRRIGDPHVSQ